MIRNGLKWTIYIYASSGFGMFQMKVELETERCASEDVWPLRR